MNAPHVHARRGELQGDAQAHGTRTYTRCAKSARALLRVDQRCTAEAGWSDFLPPSDAPETMAGYPAPEPMERARWFWKEDACNLSAHNPADVKGEFVAYAGQVCAELDEKWHAYTKLGGAAVVQVDLHGRIGSTGNEEKAHNSHTGVVFEIDLKDLQQKNATTGFAREIKREPYPVAPPATPAPPVPFHRSASGVVQGVAVDAGTPADAGTVQGNPVAAAGKSGSAVPPLAEMVARFKREFGLADSMTMIEAVGEACNALGVQKEGSLIEQAKRCWAVMCG